MIYLLLDVCSQWNLRRQKHTFAMLRLKIFVLFKNVLIFLKALFHCRMKHRTVVKQKDVRKSRPNQGLHFAAPNDSCLTFTSQIIDVEENKQMHRKAYFYEPAFLLEAKSK